jgi:hypothetical protein
MGHPVTDLRRDLMVQYSDFLKTRSYVEFGVYSGNSMSDMYELYHNHIKDLNSNFYGFDSFVGLPAENIDDNNPSYWTSGHSSFMQFALSNNQKSDVFKRLNKPRIKLIEGWFSDTLTDELAEEMKSQKIGLLHIDCDIYTSTHQALDFCFKHDLLERGSIIMYDDWAGYHEKLGEGHEFECGEGLAHKQILEKYNRTATFKEKVIVAKGSYEVAVFILE